MEYKRFIYKDNQIEFTGLIINIKGNIIEYRQDGKQYKNNKHGELELDYILWRTQEYFPNGETININKTEYNKNITFIK